MVAMPLIDLRSDTVTRPSPAMRDAMARAEVGDDVFGEDPTVRNLEEQVAALLGKEAAVFVPSGTMGNQIALLVHTRRGEEVIIGESAHLAADELGAASAWSGVGFRVAGRGGLFSADELRATISEPDGHSPRQSLVAVENTHNRAGGVPFAPMDLRAIAVVAHEEGLGLHLDGARLWNAAVATDTSEAELAAPFDTVSVCFSKGLGAPVGSALAGSRDAIALARHFRKMLGGGMRQAGVIAAGALYALEHNRARIALDHAAAKVVEAALDDAAHAIGGGRARVVHAHTNQVNVDTPGLPAASYVATARRHGVLVGAMGPFRTRAVTHLDVSEDQVRLAAQALAEALCETLAKAR
jgi:threonine aldolase